MCLYPRLIKNRKYTSNKKNGGNIPIITDERVKLIPVGCEKCMECRKQKARGWQVRLLEDIKENKNGKFITLTFSNESIVELIENPKELEALKHLKELSGYELDNAIATAGIRLFMERWRKEFKKSVRHWLVTELGHNGTENIHLHGIIWTNETYEKIEEKWKYGYIWPRPDERKLTYVNQKTVNYIIKYVHKIDKDHPNYRSKILTSAGIGGAYMRTHNARNNRFQEQKTEETYRTSTGHKISMPVYWRNKIYNDNEREKLWLQRLDKGERWIGGEKVAADNNEEIWGLLKWYREKNKKLGYGDDELNWEKIKDEYDKRRIMLNKRIATVKAKQKAAALRQIKPPLGG